MSKRRKRFPLLEKVEIIDLGAEGKAIARVDNKVLFVPYVMPGDVVDVQVNKKRKNYLEGFPVEIHTASEHRIEPACEHFGVCGGCKWQHIPYQQQLAFKQKQVVDQLTRIGKVELPEVHPIMGSENAYFYRNKLEYTFSQSKWLTREEVESHAAIDDRNALGFHIPQRFDKVLAIKRCHLQPDPSNDIRNAIHEYATKQGLDYFNLRKQEGFLRNLIIRTSTLGETMVILSLFKEMKKERTGILEHLVDTFPGITSLQYVINGKMNDTILDQEIIHHYGRDHIFEEVDGLRFKIGPKSFYQTNTGQAETMYNKVKEWADLSGKETVYDLYTGTGTIAIFLAKDAKRVVGIESVPAAIEDARENAKLNNINNCIFETGEVESLLSHDYFMKQGVPDLVVLDPPRAGLHKKVVEVLNNLEIPRIIYVSCNPATQARDMEMMKEAYKVLRIQPLDMFPQTHHVENILEMQRRG